MLVSTPDWMRPLVQLPRPAIVIAMPSSAYTTFWRASPSSRQRLASTARPERPAARGEERGVLVTSTDELTLPTCSGDPADDVSIPLPAHRAGMIQIKVLTRRCEPID
jgi:hypothetical protein